MPIHYSKKVISSTDVEKIVALSENWIIDMKGKDIKPAKLSRTVSAFANSNGGEIYLGISHFDDKDQYFWDGYKNEESFNEYAITFAAKDRKVTGDGRSWTRERNDAAICA